MSHLLGLLWWFIGLEGGGGVEACRGMWGKRDRVSDIRYEVWGMGYEVCGMGYRV